MEAMQILILERVDLKEGFLDVLQLFVDKKTARGSGFFFAAQTDYNCT